MKKLGLSEFAVELGEEVELTISSFNISDLPIIIYLDGDPVEPHNRFANTTSYKFQIAKPVGEFQQVLVQLPDTGFQNAEYKLELFGAGESIEHQLIRPADRQSFGNLIYTFSTHGAGGGSNK